MAIKLVATNRSTKGDCSMEIKIALAGNPNSGKTTMFNDLTGSAQYVAIVMIRQRKTQRQRLQ